MPQPESLTIEEAQDELRKGNFLTHAYFCIGEYIHFNDNQLKDEQQLHLNWGDFFNKRQGISWATGWSLY